MLHHSTPLRLGGWAVGLFFCLSGFWIAEMWARKYSRLDRPYVEFLISRWWRVAPVLFVATLLAAVAMCSGIVTGDTAALRNWSWWASQPLIAGSTSMGRLLPPAWSLDVEMQFYFVAPLLVAAATRLSARTQTAVLVVSLAWCGYATGRGWAGECARLDVWVGVFLLGVVASVSGRKMGPRVAVVSAVATVAFFALAAALPATRPWIVFRGANGPGAAGWLPAGLTLASILLAVPLTLATTAVTSGRFDRMLGDLSYPLYLFHWLPRQWYYVHWPARSVSVSTLAYLSVNVAVSLAGASVILWLVDRPVQKLRAAWVRRHGRAKLQACSAPAADAAFAGTV